MTERQLVYSILKMIGNAGVISKESIISNFPEIDSEKISQLLNIYIANNCIENIPLHGGYHNIGSYDSNQFSIKHQGRLFIEQYEEIQEIKHQQNKNWILGLAITIISGIIIPFIILALGYYLSHNQQ